MGFGVYDRETGGWEEEDEVKKKPVDKDMDVNVPVEEINDEEVETPEVDIEDDGRDTQIVPVTPEIGNGQNEEDVIRKKILDDGILDDINPDSKVEIN